MKLYQILGIEVSASAAEIKRAYRKLAHKFHPDRAGGDTAKFKEVATAYAILSDENKRAHYDRTGEVEEDKCDYEASSDQTVRNLFNMAIDLDLDNILGFCVEKLSGSLILGEGCLLQEKQLLKRTTKYKNRLVCKGGGENLFTHVVDERIKKISASIKIMETGITITRLALEKVQQYSTSPEAPLDVELVQPALYSAPTTGR